MDPAAVCIRGFFFDIDVNADLSHHHFTHWESQLEAIPTQVLEQVSKDRGPAAVETWMPQVVIGERVMRVV